MWKGFLIAEDSASFWSCSCCHLCFLHHLNHVEKSQGRNKINSCLLAAFLCSSWSPPQHQNKHPNLVPVPNLQIRNQAFLWSSQKTLSISTIITLTYLRTLCFHFISLRHRQVNHSVPVTSQRFCTRAWILSISFWSSSTCFFNVNTLIFKSACNLWYNNVPLSSNVYNR